MDKKENMISVIIPVNEFSDEGFKMLHEAVDSVDMLVPIIISCPNGTNVEKIGKFPSERKVTFIDKSNGSSFQELVNAGVESVETDWFSILEYDDKYTDIWYNNVKRYIEFKPDTSVFMVFEDIFEHGTGKYLSMGNESPWASSFSEEIGYLDNQALQSFFDYYMTGCVFKKKDWEDVGGLKEKIKVTFWYEWLLRCTRLGKKVFVIPKIGYIHIMGRKGSLTEIYQSSMEDKEVEWWFDLAKRDSFFKEQKSDDYYVYKEKKEDDDDGE